MHVTTHFYNQLYNSKESLLSDAEQLLFEAIISIKQNISWVLSYCATSKRDINQCAINHTVNYEIFIYAVYMYIEIIRMTDSSKSK